MKSPLLTFLEAHHQPISDEFRDVISQLEEVTQNGSTCLDISGQQDFIDTLNTDSKQSVVGNANDYSPLILHNEHLYLHRYFSYESMVLERLLSIASNQLTTIPTELSREISSLAPDSISDDQANAILCALAKQLCIITGGPGTGKTTTVIRILHYLHQLGTYTSPDQVMILAPTGKAADRLRQSISEGILRLNLNPATIPSNTSTIHRGLGYRRNSIDFRHNDQNPLPAKVVIIDETSMIDLPLMAKLLQALAPDSKLIMLGDENQLTSVEVGSVLADIIQEKQNPNHPLKDNIATLVTRFRTQGAIQQVCDMINIGDSTAVLNCIRESDAKQKGHVLLENPSESLIHSLEPLVLRHWLPILKQSKKPKEILTEMEKFRILCPTHHGSQGIDAVNRAVEYILSKNGIDTRDRYYHGRSIIVQSNNLELNLFNGDTGVCIKSNNKYEAHFSDQAATKSYHPSLLPEHNTSWALTIHRTQGSEYDHVLIILPDYEDNLFVSQQLLYTAVSRAKISASIWSKPETLAQCIESRTTRASGLSQRLLATR